MIKRTLFTAILLFAFLSADAADISTFSQAFESGNAALFKGKMNEQVDISIPAISKKTNGNEAIEILNAFFEKHRPVKFSIAHHAERKESGFFVGKLETETTSFRVNITYLTKDEQVFIQVIRIE